MADYKTPGVYVEEISTLPPSVAQVPTAVPAFIGYTEFAKKSGKSLNMVPTRITSLLEYTELFGGGPDPVKISVKLDDKKTVESVTFAQEFYLYDSIRMYFANGGGVAYIVSVGEYGVLEEDPGNPGEFVPHKPEADALQAGIMAVEKEDHPTMLLCPDAMLLAKSENAYALQQLMLKQCNEMQDRIGVLDVYDGYVDRRDNDVVLDFRNGVGINYLKYASAYYPWIQTTLSHKFGFEDVSIEDHQGNAVDLKDFVADPTPLLSLNEVIADLGTIQTKLDDPFDEGKDVTIKSKYHKVPEADLGTAAEVTHYAGVIKTLIEVIFAWSQPGILTNSTLANEVTLKVKGNSPLSSQTKGLVAVLKALGDATIGDADFEPFELDKVEADAGLAAITDPVEQVRKAKGSVNAAYEAIAEILLSIKSDAMNLRDHFDQAVYDTNPLYKSIVNDVQKEACKLPPSGAAAGVYAQVDANRGVWKAPANVSLASTVRPWVRIDNKQQEDLNVDVVAGKSINAIRAFTGKGTLIWGARTLAGNDNEWRYVSVRRFFIMVEQSVKLSTNWAVFEPNDSNTWIRVKAMIENYLTNLWKAGALAGATPDAAFFVNVGLGSTMTAVDILEGRMNIEIGMAAVRPAEFIILKFSHKLQES